MFLAEMGYAKSSGYGAIPIDYTDIKAFSEITQTKLSGWDALMLRRLSVAYCGERNNTEKHAHAPYMGEFRPKSFKTIREKLKK